MPVSDYGDYGDQKHVRKNRFSLNQDYGRSERGISNVRTQRTKLSLFYELTLIFSNYTIIVIHRSK